MPFEPNKITKDHILEAIEIVKEKRANNETVHKSTGWDLIWEDEDYPPKVVMRYAHELMSGERIWHPTGGEPTNKYLKKIGFTIIDKREDPEHEIEFFTNEDLLLLKKWANRKYDNSEYHKQIGEKLKKGPWNKTKFWASKVAKEVGLKSEVRRIWTNQAQNFSSYTWGKIYDLEQWTNEIFFTVGINEGHKEPFFHIKIDYQFRGSNELTDEQLKLCDELTRDDSGIRYEEVIESNEIGRYDWNKLIDVTKKFLLKYEQEYYSIVAQVGSETEYVDTFKNKKTALTDKSNNRPTSSKFFGNRQGGKYQIRRFHDEISRKLEDYLRSVKSESEKIIPENKLDNRAIDVVYIKADEIRYYEIKTYQNVRMCIREGLGQLLEYAHWNREKLNKDLKLIIVSKHKPNNELKEYINRLQREYSLCIYYQQFDIKENKLGDLIGE